MEKSKADISRNSRWWNKKWKADGKSYHTCVAYKKKCGKEATILLLWQEAFGIVVKCFLKDAICIFILRYELHDLHVYHVI